MRQTNITFGAPLHLQPNKGGTSLPPRLRFTATINTTIYIYTTIGRFLPSQCLLARLCAVTTHRTQRTDKVRCHIIMNDPNLNVICWNVRGLNTPARRTTVHETLSSTTCHLACLQEMKLQVVDQELAYYLGGHRLHNFAQRPASGTRGSILLLWNDDHIAVEDIQLEEYSLSATAQIKDCGTVFRLTVVYGPSRDSEKPAFLQELKSLRPPSAIRWLVLGDFNLIYKASDKNKGNIKRARMGQFKSTLDICELKEMHLQNRKFTWSNE